MFKMLFKRTINLYGNFLKGMDNKTIREHPLMTSDIRVGRGSKIVPKLDVIE